MKKNQPKYYLVYNINAGGSTAINRAFPSTDGEMYGTNLKELVKDINKILTAYGAKRGAAFNWWYDIYYSFEYMHEDPKRYRCLSSYVRGVHNFTYDD